MFLYFATLPSSSSEQGRLTAEQKIVLQEMVRILGEEVKKSISYLFCTFADSKRLPVLESAKEAGLKYKMHFAVNSSAYFPKEGEEGEIVSSIDKAEENTSKAKTGSIHEMLWNLTTESIRSFIMDIQNNSPIPVRIPIPPNQPRIPDPRKESKEGRRGDADLESGSQPKRKGKH